MLGIVLALLVAGSEPDTAYLASGAKLLSWCDSYGSERPEPETALCFGYIQGFLDSMTQYDLGLAMMVRLERVAAGVEKRPLQPTLPPLACFPSDTTYGQHVRVLVKYLRDHPEKLHEPRSHLMLAAMTAAYPCPKAAWESAPLVKEK